MPIEDRRTQLDVIVELDVMDTVDLQTKVGLAEGRLADADILRKVEADAPQPSGDTDAGARYYAKFGEFVADADLDAALDTPFALSADRASTRCTSPPSSTMHRIDGGPVQMRDTGTQDGPGLSLDEPAPEPAPTRPPLLRSNTGAP